MHTCALLYLQREVNGLGEWYLDIVYQIWLPFLPESHFTIVVAPLVTILLLVTVYLLLLLLLFCNTSCYIL